ncbi:sigma-70 family RNA polymerase sigma factor [Mucilaginibacter segetis]|uniref:Sigma-70 family RNA polymerase sigma factor n=1 Tax=Mucilaginibacter segetis TaxID=2793071 RepID=A0A934PSR4_9SPHI|nr:sigma-70 family RNA polymerase sigma factor [Mucilaginibacter segetis]MBK0378735.1 sigma-70 family RNA polymerase sigma factor [Mucilaginibacter segetis]
MDAENMSVVVTLDGFESIFKDNYTPLYRYVNSIIKDKELSKDVLSDLFLNLWQQKNKLQIANIKPYLFRSARNGALKALTAQNQISQLPDDAFNIPSDSYNPFERFVAKQSIKIVDELINKLPAKRREMIELRLLGLKNYEIANVMDIPEKNVEYNMREAIEQLSHAVNHSQLDKATIASGLMLINIIFTISQ